MRIRYVILGLGALLTMLITFSFLYLQFFLHEKSIVTSGQNKENTITETQWSTIFIEKINENALKGFHIEENKSLTKSLTGMEARDKNGNKMPLSQLKAGQIVEMNHQVITPVASLHTISNLTGIKIDLKKMTVQVGSTKHHLADEILAVDALGNRLSLTDISPYDIVSLTIYQDKVWSITREKASARLLLTDVPKETGQIAIDNSRLMQLKDTKEGIPITPGEHKIVVKILGYVPLSIHIVIEEGETYTLSLKDAKIAYTTIQPQLNVDDYRLSVAQKVYTAQDTIKLPQGQYTVTIQASGYRTWRGKLDLNKDIYLLRVNLIELEEEADNTIAVTEEDIIFEDEETTDFLEDMVDNLEAEIVPVSTTLPTNPSSTSNATSTNTSNTTSDSTLNDTSSHTSNTTSSDTSSNTSNTTSNDTSNTSNTSSSNTQRTITLSTSPSGASIYQGDTLIGTSPFTMQLADGTHEFTIQKEDYTPYHAKVTLDSTDEGGIYLYKLKKTEKTE